MFFIVSGDIPWKEKKNSTHIIIALSNKVVHARPDDILDDHWNLIQKYWSWNPVDRPEATEVIGCLATKITRHKTIVVFGETGAGKSSLINLMAGEEIANTSPDMQRCTMLWKEYPIDFNGESYTVFDTIGLEEPQPGVKEYLESVENAYRLVRELNRRGGIDLLLFCIRAGRVPIVLAITNLEREVRMEDWWVRNHSTFEKYQIQVAGHAYRVLYEESRTIIRDLVKKFTADEQKQTWMGGDNLFVSLMCNLKGLLASSPRVREMDLVPHLMKRSGAPPNIA
ncbi:P-loop containing nucleoside triphosphate hydrolase protein [Suillus subalutaceus]|uniref:P-loop containing nucleoside triphosphate hydrolase protein n=1 Tax=Suillus subalutaceus TaxID=48586 RepID=UPI001B86FDA8|nr:P-loop containing nucleoside triphosphate hydrolase protein [Suillus subalutaceus]KAG1856376.1 P-loop containing nucleoside triphosphate hydrolase protein [Suillus subalutaceus]